MRKEEETGKGVGEGGQGKEGRGRKGSRAGREGGETGWKEGGGRRV